MHSWVGWGPHEWVGRGMHEWVGQGGLGVGALVRGMWWWGGGMGRMGAKECIGS